MNAWLQLMRFPAVFTAWCDVWLGWTIITGELSLDWRLILLTVTSSAMYLSGMVFNDWFDRKLDAIERPERPIPSGKISPASAARLGTALIGGGLVVSALIPGGALFIACLLAASILLYDGFLKQTWAGPLGMGVCRFLNVLLGGAICGELSVWLELCVVAAGLAIYIIGVTVFARQEGLHIDRRGLLGGLLLCGIGIGWLIYQVWRRDSSAWTPLSSLLLIYVLLSLNVRALPVLVQPDSNKVQGIVRLMLLHYVMLCATLILGITHDARQALLTASLVFPPWLLRRMISIT